MSDRGQSIPLLTRWLKRARESLFSHYTAAENCAKLNRRLGIPVLILTTIVGTSVFASLQQKVDPILQILVGLISVAAAILSGLQTFLGFAERAEKHRMTAARYSALRREIEFLLTFENNTKLHDPEHLDALRIKIDKLGEEAPSITSKIWDEAGRKISIADKDQILTTPVVSKPA
jgi:hypothetical protein